MVNLASTESVPRGAGRRTASLAAFEAALDANDAAITPAMRYFYVANKLGIPYCNFTPSLTNVPALEQHADEMANPFAGMDGKTGQTLLKTALAAMLRVRRLHIEGWYSTNFLGNNDGSGARRAGVEQDQGAVASRRCSTRSSATTVENHQVHIHYYKPRGDSKEAWDNIDIVGFAGVPMQIKINFLCQDSALAAPLVIDLVRLLDVAKRARRARHPAPALDLLQVALPRAGRDAGARPLQAGEAPPRLGAREARPGASATAQVAHATNGRARRRRARDDAEADRALRRHAGRSRRARIASGPIVGDDERRAVARVLDRGVLSGSFAPESRGASRRSSRDSSGRSTRS